VAGKVGNCLSKFADLLMANDAQQRRSLLKWHKVLAILKKRKNSRKEFSGLNKTCGDEDYEDDGD